jgi:uncharacterized membrane protein
MKNQPKFKPEPTNFDLRLEWAGYLLLLMSWIFATWVYAESPKQIATHFNAKGQPDDFGNKITVLLLPLFSTFTFVGMTLINQYPHTFNYPAKITAENMEQHYRAAMRLIRWLKISIVLVFLLIAYAMYLSSRQNEASGIVEWILPIILLITFLPLIFYFLNLPKKSK